MRAIIVRKIIIKEFARKRKQSKENTFFLDESEDFPLLQNDFNNFLQSKDVNQKNQPSTLSVDSIINISSQNPTCPKCNFVSKSKTGLKVHMRKHKTKDVKTVENENEEDKNEDRIRIPCPFSPSRTFVDRKRLQTHLDKKHSDEILHLKSLESTNLTILTAKLMNYRNNVPTLRRIPKGARSSAADKLAKIINNSVDKNSVFAWEQLLTLSYISFNVKGDKVKSLTSKVKENIKNFNNDITVPLKKNPISLSRRIEAKVADFDIKGAIKNLSSSDKLAPFNEETVQIRR